MYLWIFRCAGAGTQAYGMDGHPILPCSHRHRPGAVWCHTRCTILFARWKQDAQNILRRLLAAQITACSLLGVAALVSICSAFKIAQLKSGGSYVARSVGGREVDPNAQDADERKLLNVVEEMAIASGVPMPAVFIMEEAGINGFAAGFNPRTQQSQSPAAASNPSPVTNCKVSSRTSSATYSMAICA